MEDNQPQELAFKFRYAQTLLSRRGCRLLDTDLALLAPRMAQLRRLDLSFARRLSQERGGFRGGGGGPDPGGGIDLHGGICGLAQERKQEHKNKKKDRTQEQDSSQEQGHEKKESTA